MVYKDLYNENLRTKTFDGWMKLRLKEIQFDSNEE